MDACREWMEDRVTSATKAYLAGFDYTDLSSVATHPLIWTALVNSPYLSELEMFDEDIEVVIRTLVSVSPDEMRVRVDEISVSLPCRWWSRWRGLGNDPIIAVFQEGGGRRHRGTPARRHGGTVPVLRLRAHHPHRGLERRSPRPRRTPVSAPSNSLLSMLSVTHGASLDVVPEESRRLADRLSAVHGDVHLANEASGWHLYMASPLLIAQGQKNEVHKRHLAVNAARYFGWVTSIRRRARGAATSAACA
jgi:hypothetical protein